MTNKELIELLNKAIKMELRVCIQYMWQHILWEEKETRKALEKTAITEMKHAEKIAKRVVALGGTPATEPTPVEVGETPDKMIAIDIENEKGAIVFYKKVIETAEKLGDHETANLFKEILSDEKKHLKFFQETLEKLHSND